MARDLGAVAALLYTTTAEACLINPEYADPANFDQVFDIYTTIRKSMARSIYIYSLIAVPALMQARFFMKTNRIPIHIRWKSFILV